MAGCVANARNGHISTSGLKPDVTIVFLDSVFHRDTKISAAIRVHLRLIKDYLIFAWIMRISGPIIGVWGQNGGEVVRYWPLTHLFSFWGFLCLCQFWWKSTNKRDRESAHNRRPHRLPDANRFYDLSHMLCYGTGKYKSFITTSLILCDISLFLKP